MTKTHISPKQITKKHLARQERERLQTRFILLGSLGVLLLVILLIGYGALDTLVLQYNRPVAKVSGDVITTRDFQASVRLARRQIIANYAQIQAFLGNDTTYLQQVQTQLEPTYLGQQILTSLIDDRIIRQEAARRGITVSAEEVEKAVQEQAFGYYPLGTPTTEPTSPPAPTMTLSPLQMTWVAPTATEVPTATATATLAPSPTATLAPTNTPTAGPTPTDRPTATPYTLEGYQADYKSLVESMGELKIPESEIKRTFESQLLREKVMEAVLAEMTLSQEEEQVWARHILVSSEVTATQLLEQINNGADFATLAIENSTDTGSAAQGGDLGWFGRGQMVPEFETAAFALQVGEVVTQPVQSEYGFHIIQVLGHAVNPLTDSDYQALREEKFQEWLDARRAALEAEGQIVEYNWIAVTPSDPELPAEYTQQQAVATQSP